MSLQDLLERQVELAKSTAESQEQSGIDNVNADLENGQQFADELLGEDFALTRIGDSDVTNSLRDQFTENASMSDEERIARRESAFNSLDSSEGTQNRSLLRSLSAAGVRGGAAAGAIGSLSNSQAQDRRELTQNLFIEEQELEREGLRDLANFEEGVQQFDISQEQAELSTRLQTQLQGASLFGQERSALRQQEAALAANKAAKSGKK